MNQFVADDNVTNISYKLMLFDNAHLIPPSTQQVLKKIIQDNTSKLRFIFVCPDFNKLIGHITSKATMLRTQRIQQRDALIVLLVHCYRHNIGYNRHGLIALFTHNPEVCRDSVSCKYLRCNRLI